MSLRAEKILTALSWVVLATFALTVALGLFIPLYTDEVVTKMQLSRTVVEGGRMVSLFPQCEPAFAQALPVSGYPAALLYHLVFSKLGLLGLRVSAVLAAFGWFGAAFCAIARTTLDRAARVRRLAAFVALHAFGVVPLTLVSARAEPTLLLALGAYVAFPLAWSIETRRTWWSRALVTTGFVILTSVFYFSHSKALLFAPFVLVSAGLTFTWRRPGWLFIAGALVILTVVQSHHRARVFTSCEEAPNLQAMLQWMTLDPAEAGKAPMAFLSAGAKNVEKHTSAMSDAMALEPTGARWVPLPAAEPMPELVDAADAWTRVWIYVLVVGVPVLVLATAVRAIRKPRARRPMLLALTLLACIAAHVFLSNHWNYYNTPFVLTALALDAALATLVIGAVLSDETRHRLRSAIVLGGILLHVLAVASMWVMLGHLGPRLVALGSHEGTLVQGHPAWVTVFGYPAERDKIRAHAAKCGIRGDGAKHLVIDDATLFAFEGLREPLHLIYVTDATMWGPDIREEKNLALLRSVESPGIISRCSYLPTLLVDRAQKENGYCCVGADDLR